MLVKDKIKEYRKERGLSASALAQMIGVSPGNMSRYEHGYVRVIPENVLEKLAGVFECNVNDLVKDDPAYKHLQSNEQRKKLSSVISSDDDQMLLQWFHSLSPEVKNYVRESIKLQLKNTAA